MSAALLLLGALAFSVDARLGVVSVGPADAPTGGVAPGLAVGVQWPIHQALSVSVGAMGSAWGFGADAHWIGGYGGPVVGVAWRPIPALALSVEGDVGVGRVPICYPWGFCIRWIGVFPAVAAGIGYRWGVHYEVGAKVTSRYYETLAWSGLGWEGSATGRLTF